MNICFYTSAAPSIVNLLNANYLINKRPHHNYSFLKVAGISHKPTLKKKLRDFYIQTRFNDGRFDFQRDNLAIERHLKTYLQNVDIKNFHQEEVLSVNDLKSEAYLSTSKPDVIIQAGAGILTENIFSKAQIATINVHHGIAPQIRGIESTFWCMFYGIRDKIGVTCHFIDKQLDTGAIILQENLHILSGNFIDVQTQNFLAGQEVLVKSIDILEKGGYKITNQGQVKSYYFGLADNFLYYALKKRNFQPLMNISQKAFKMKDFNLLS